MRIAGGIVGLIAGIFGVFSALLTLAVGGVGSAFQVHGSSLVVGLGFGGLLSSFLVIVLGAVCIGTTSLLPGILLVLCALAGIFLGGTFVALFMGLAFIGGVLAVVSAKPKSDGGPQLFSRAGQESQDLLRADEIIGRYRETAQARSTAPGLHASPPAFGKRLSS
jgi:hypothetical protein